MIKFTRHRIYLFKGTVVFSYIHRACVTITVVNFRRLIMVSFYEGLESEYLYFQCFISFTIIYLKNVFQTKTVR